MRYPQIPWRMIRPCTILKLLEINDHLELIIYTHAMHISQNYSLRAICTKTKLKIKQFSEIKAVLTVFIYIKYLAKGLLTVGLYYVLID